MRGEEFLTRPEQYALVYNKGRSWSTNLVVIKVLPNGLTLSRHGISVSKRVGKAVVRNRVKRRLREILRLATLQAGWDIVLIARTPSAIADYNSLKTSVERLLSRAGILMREYEAACLKVN